MIFGHIELAVPRKGGGIYMHACLCTVCTIVIFSIHWHLKINQAFLTDMRLGWVDFSSHLENV